MIKKQVRCKQVDDISASGEFKNGHTGSEQWSMQPSILPVAITKYTDTFDPALEQWVSSSAFSVSL